MRSKKKGSVNNDHTLNLKRTVIIRQYAPKVFRKIRLLNNIKDQDLIESLDPSKNIKQIQNAGEGAGASGSFFFFSHDRKFIMKTMSKLEINHLIRVLPHYYDHLNSGDQCSLAKIYGVFTVRMDSFEAIHLMIMHNTVPNIDDT